jgi:hypothetical protein
MLIRCNRTAVTSAVSFFELLFFTSASCSRRILKHLYELCLIATRRGVFGDSCSQCPLGVALVNTSTRCDCPSKPIRESSGWFFFNSIFPVGRKSISPSHVGSAKGPNPLTFRWGRCKILLVHFFFSFL